jgi:hypothetical protein
MDFVTGAMAITTLLGGTVAVTVPAMSGPDCNTVIEMRKDGPVTVKTCDDGSQYVRPTQIIAKAAPGTGGLIFRDEQGNDLGSGIGENQTFIFTNCGPKGSGLISVYQLDSARKGTSGGWGGLYAGYIKKAYTEDPSKFPCK